MKTRFIRVDSKNPDKAKISQAANILTSAGLVAFPTETVYGLGADALNSKAVRKIYKAKGRPRDNPMIVHVASVKDAKRLVKRFPLKAIRLTKKFWPGPLTIILPKDGSVPKETTAGLNTVALRMPDHPVALALLREANVPIAAPSANSSGKPSPTTAAHVKNDLDGQIDAIIDGGPSRIGVESTVIDMSTKTPTILRPGAVTVEQIRRILKDVRVHQPSKNEKKPRSPGMKYRHYAPKARLILVVGEEKDVAAKAMELAAGYTAKGKKARIIGAKGKTQARTAAQLYGLMRKYDKERADIIIAEATTEKGLGLAVMNRLRKAATKTVVA
ncbi:MAG: L-threonylcarbamoyladenylate synthase [Candidatus Altiarchaeota archaeon]